MVNHVVTLLMPPRKLARLDFKAGIPADCATFVVVPSMLVRPDSAANLLERLEITYLANPDPQLRFALLTDFADAPEEHRPEDDGYILAALDGVRALNDRYAGGRARPVLPLPSPADLEPGPGLLDGLGAEARQALRVQPPAPGRPRRPTTSSGAPTRPTLPRMPVRHHARRRHDPAPRERPAAGRDAGPPAQRPPVRPGQAAGWSRGTASCSRG